LRLGAFVTPGPRMGGITAGVLIAVLPVLSVAFHKDAGWLSFKLRSVDLRLVLPGLCDQSGLKQFEFRYWETNGHNLDGERLDWVARERLNHYVPRTAQGIQ
jgi:hypothetical protein